MTLEFLTRIVESECVYINGDRYLPPVPVRDGREYWFQVQYYRGGVLSVQGLVGNVWREWLKDLRKECSLGAIES